VDRAGRVKVQKVHSPGVHLMQESVYRTLELLCAVVSALPLGTNLGLLHLLWMLVSGRLLATRGALFAGLSEAGLTPEESRRAWAALGQGAWSSERVIRQWTRVIEREGRWRATEYGGYRPVAADITGFWRPRLKGCPTKHFQAEAGRALPAIVLGLVVRVGGVAGQRLALPVALVRADPADPSPRALLRQLVRTARSHLAEDEVLVCDREFGVALLQEESGPRFLVRLPKNFTARRASPPPYRKRGRPPTRGELVRPLPRQRSGRSYPATSPDEVVFWTEGRRTLRAAVWRDLVLPDAPAGSPTFRVLAIHDPRYREPLVLATPLPLDPSVARALYRDRWPVEQLPLAGKQMIGAARQFVHAPETCQRLPELALLAGAFLSYAAATSPAVPTGFWDRHPQPTSGRLRRVLARCPFPRDFPLPARLRQKAAATAQLPTGFYRPRCSPTRRRQARRRAASLARAA
jgi:hypothetical protein